jgi:hypothetical protein
VSWKLANQLMVAMMPDPRVNLVSVEVRYMVGAADEPAGKPGLAHRVEHVMFARRAGPGGPDIYNQLAAAALSYQAGTRRIAPTTSKRCPLAVPNPGTPGRPGRIQQRALPRPGHRYRHRYRVF